MKKDWLAFVHEFKIPVQSMNDRPNILQIDLGALIANLVQLRSLLDRQTAIMAIVKSDAYGHGLLQVSRTLEEQKVESLGVAHFHEGAALRASGIKLPIAILCGIQTAHEAQAAVENDLLPVVFDPEMVEMLEREASLRGRKASIYLKVDTGMGRLGIPHGDVVPFLERIRNLGSLKVMGLTSHLSSADEPDGDFTRQQIDSFRRAIQAARSMGLKLPNNNLANSAGVMAHRDSWFDMIRPGIMLYGGLPSPGFPSGLPLRPVMHFKGRILQVRELPPRTPVSYGRTYTTDGPRQIAVTSAGYGDGLPRSLSNRGHVLIHENLAPIVGTICMNLTLCDVTHIGGARTGDDAVFLGTQGDKTITGDDIARNAETISYEVFCSIGQRNNKEYV